jgi:hypothetical protein
VHERVGVKSPVQEYCTPGSVRGALGNWRPYLDTGSGAKIDTWRLKGY